MHSVSTFDGGERTVLQEGMAAVRAACCSQPAQSSADRSADRSACSCWWHRAAVLHQVAVGPGMGPALPAQRGVKHLISAELG